MKKSEERAIIKAFVQYSGIPGLSLLDIDRESPDALILSADGPVGVEHTKLSEAAPRQAVAPQDWFAKATEVVDSARAIFESRNDQSVVVSFGMTDVWRPPVRSDLSMLAAQLAALVERVLDGSSQAPSESHTLRSPLPSVAWAYIRRSNVGHRWTPSTCFSVRPASQADIVATVLRKEAKLPAYRLVAPNVWLLVDCDLTGQGIALAPPTVNLSIISSFDRVFCCGFGGGEWVEVPVRPGD